MNKEFYFQMEQNTRLSFPEYRVYEQYKEKHEYRNHSGKSTFFDLLELLFNVNWMFYNAFEVFQQTFQRKNEWNSKTYRFKRYIGMSVDDLNNAFEPIKEVFL